MKTKEFKRILLSKDRSRIEADKADINKICGFLTSIQVAINQAQQDTKVDLQVFGTDFLSNINNLVYFNPSFKPAKPNCPSCPPEVNSEIVVNSISDYVKRQMALAYKGNFGGLPVSLVKLFDFIELPASVAELEEEIKKFRAWLKGGKEARYLELRDAIDFDGNTFFPGESINEELEELYSRFTESEEENERYEALTKLVQDLNELSEKHGLKLRDFEVLRTTPNESLSYSFNPHIVLTSYQD
jgi:hypothetical protein